MARLNANSRQSLRAETHVARYHLPIAAELQRRTGAEMPSADHHLLLPWYTLWTPLYIGRRATPSVVSSKYVAISAIIDKQAAS